MRLTRLRLTNFRQHVDTDIEFDSGLTGIIGPNGAGKSTILEAIAFALYGSNAARGAAASIKFQYAPARAPLRVELEFELAGHRYRVVRGSEMAELFLDGGAETIADSITTVNEALRRRLGMTRTEFFYTYFTGQKELAFMQSLTPAARAQFLSRVLGYDRLRIAQELCAERRKALASEKSGMESELPARDAVLRQEAEATEAWRAATRLVADAEERHRETDARLKEIAPRWLAAQLGRDERERLERDLAAINAEDGALERAATQLEAELTQVADARAQLETLSPAVAEFERVTVALETQRQLEADEKRRRVLETSRTNLGNDVATMDRDLERLRASAADEPRVASEVAALRQALEDASGKLELRRTEWVREQESVESRLRTLRATYTELRDQRETLLTAGEDGNCPTCTRALGAHYRTVLEVLDQQLETVEADGAYFRTRAEQLKPTPADIAHLDALRRKLQIDLSALDQRLAGLRQDQHRIPGLEADLAAKRTRLASVAAELATIPFGYDAEAHHALERERDRLVEVTRVVQRLQSQIEREPIVLTKRQENAAERARLRERRAAATAQLSALRVPDGDYGELRRLHEDAATAHADATQQVAVAQATCTGALAAAERAAADRRSYEASAAKVAALGAEHRLHDELYRALGDFRNDINGQMRPDIAGIASDFLRQLTDGRYTELELDDKYRLTVLEEGIPKTVISGGEEDVANLVIRLAISQMIADRSGQPFSLLILDEVFGSLDDVRQHNVLQLLRGLHDRFEQVIVITHIEGVRDGLDQVLEVRLDDPTKGARVTRADRVSVEEFAAAGASA